MKLMFMYSQIKSTLKKELEQKRNSQYVKLLGNICLKNLCYHNFSFSNIFC